MVKRSVQRAANVPVSGTATEIELFPRPGVMGKCPLDSRGKTGGTAILIVLSYEGTFFLEGAISCRKTDDAHRQLTLSVKGQNRKSVRKQTKTSSSKHSVLPFVSS